MTKKDFKLIAATLKEAKPNEKAPFTELDEVYAWRKVVEAFESSLKGTNERFDAYKFLVACGYPV